MKILLFAASNSVHTHKWALFFQSRGYQVKVVTFYNHYDPNHAKEIDTLILPKFLPRKLSYPTSVFALKKILADYQPDIFHAHYVSSYGVIAALTNYRPLYISVWGSDIYDFPTANKFKRKMVEYALNCADVICSTSFDMAKETKKYTDKEVEITPFGVDLHRFKPLNLTRSDEMITIGTAKGLQEVYGISQLIKGFAKIEKEYPQARLLIVGDGPKRTEYENMVHQLGIAHKTTFTGYVSNKEVPYYINQMDIFVLPSYRESFGVAAVEAQACGVPVVVTNVGGLPEVVEHEGTGLIIPDNHPDHLSHAFKRLIQDPKLRHEMGAKGMEYVKKRYDWTENASRMIALYERTLKTKIK